MLDLSNLDWYEISDTEEQATDKYGNVFTREKDIITLPLFCSLCKNMISSIEDVESMKSVDCCKDCKDIYYYPNKEKWESGWRPEN